MTVDQYLEKSADDLAKMTDEELDGYFKPYYQFCRPAPQDPTKPHSSKIHSSVIPAPATKRKKEASPKLEKMFFEAALAQARQMGLKV